MNQSAVALVISLALSACCVSPAKQMHSAHNYEAEVGWLHGNCLAIKNPELSPATKMKLVYLANAQTFGNATIQKKAASAEDCFALNDDRKSINIDNGYSFYVLESDQPINLAIGMLNSDTDLSAYQFNTCTTSEGIRFSVSLNTALVWSGYYYLGYDTESTCDNQQ